MKFELVVARYREDTRWLRRVPKAFRVTVYDKDHHAGSPNPLPNVGREAHTYLHHIIARYDSLADVTVFSQGKPFDHVSDFHYVLRDLADGRRHIENFLWLGFIIDRDDRTGSHLFQNWSKNTDRQPLAMDAFFHAVWHHAAPDEFIFYPGAHFVVTAEVIRRQPREFYERAQAASLSVRDAAHCFERCWDHVFGVAGVPPELIRAGLPAYFKPIRRLAVAHASREG